MKTHQQIQIEQIPFGELRRDPALKQREQLNQAGMGVGGQLSTTLQPRNQCAPTRELSRVSQIKIRIDFRRLTPWAKEDQYRNPTN